MCYFLEVFRLKELSRNFTLIFSVVHYLCVTVSFGSSWWFFTRVLYKLWCLSRSYFLWNFTARLIGWLTKVKKETEKLMRRCRPPGPGCTLLICCKNFFYYLINICDSECCRFVHVWTKNRMLLWFKTAIVELMRFSYFWWKISLNCQL